MLSFGLIFISFSVFFIFDAFPDFSSGCHDASQVGLPGSLARRRGRKNIGLERQIQYPPKIPKTKTNDIFVNLQYRFSFLGKPCLYFYFR